MCPILLRIVLCVSRKYEVPSFSPYRIFMFNSVFNETFVVNFFFSLHTTFYDVKLNALHWRQHSNHVDIFSMTFLRGLQWHLFSFSRVNNLTRPLSNSWKISTQNIVLNTTNTIFGVVFVAWKILHLNMSKSFLHFYLHVPFSHHIMYKLFYNH